VSIWKKKREKTSKLKILFFKLNFSKISVDKAIWLWYYIRAQKMKLNLAKHFDRNRLIQWFYYNQSKEQRMAYNGRLFMVCEGNSYLEKIALKQDFDQMEIKIKAYMEFLNKENFEFNAVTIKDPSGSSLVKSEIIPLKPYKENFKTLIMKPCPICGKKREITVARINAYRGNIISKCESCYSYNNI